MALLDVLPDLPSPPGEFGVAPTASPLPAFAAPQPLAFPQLAATSPLAALAPSNAGHETSFLNKVTDLRDFYNSLQPHVRNALIQYDADRVSRGTAPLTREETLAAGQAANTQQLPAEGTHNKHWYNVFGNAVSDLRSIIGSVPRLLDPRTWLHEAQDIPHILERVKESQAQGASPLEAWANAPGVRLIPGSFIAGNIQHPSHLLEHPLFTGLDVLPYASKAAEFLPVVKASSEAARGAEEALRLLPADASMADRAALLERAQHVPALRTALTRTLSPAGEIVPNRIGQFTGELAKSPLGQLASTAFGKQTREAMRFKSQLENRQAAVTSGLLPATSELEATTQEAVKLGQKYGMTPEESIATVQKFQHGDRFAYNPKELALANEYREVTNRYARDISTRTGELAEFEGEWYPREQAGKLQAARTVAESTKRISILRDEYLSPSGTLTPEDFTRTAATAAETTTPRLARHELEALTRTADAYGFDMSAARQALSVARNVAGYRQVAQSISDAVQQPAATRIPMQSILDQLARQPSHSQATRLAKAIAANEPTEITSAINNLLNQTNSRLHFLDDPGVIDTLKSYKDRIKWENKHGKRYTSARAARFERAAVRAADRNFPARYAPLITETTRRRAVDQVLASAPSDVDVARITHAITEANWTDAESALGAQAGTVKKLYSGIEQEVSKSWRELKAAGADPEFIHSAPRSRASTVNNPRIGPVPTTVSQIRRRALDMSPAVDDWAVSLTHQGVEQMSRQASEQMIDYVIQRFGIKQSDLQAEFGDVARGANQSLNFAQRSQDIIGKLYERFDPDARGYSWGGATMDKYRQDTWFIPKPLAGNLHRIANPKGLLGAAFDPFTKKFRVAVVGLSPRTQLYNILGGGMMVFGETGPGAFRYWRQAWNLRRHPELIHDEILRASIGSQKRELFTSDLARAKAQTSVLMGKTAARMFDHATQSGVIQKLKSAGGKVVEKSFDLNGFFDDQYRIMAYLYGHDKALTKGMSEEMARRAGEELLHKTMMDFSTLTPIETDVFRTVFPFYSFMRHAIRYVTRYPVDHPLRASVLGAFGKAETDDLNGLPLSFLSMIPIGHESSTGHQNFLSLGAVNPFSGAPDMFTIAGWLSATNPVISSALESVGIDSRGAAELYPTLVFDPETGRLTAQHPNLLQSLAQNTIPQTQLLTSALGINAQFNEQLSRDPAGALRSLVSAGGFPILWRDKSVPQEFFRAEVNRFDAVKQQQSALLKAAAPPPPSPGTLTDEVHQALSGQVAALQGTPGNDQSIFTHT